MRGNSEPTASSRRRSGVVLGLQTVVTLGLAIWLALSVDRTIWRTLADIDLTSFTTAVLLFASAQVFGGLRLHLILARPQVSRYDAVFATLVGYFAANFLPGTIGGDAVRGYRIYKAGVPVGPTAAALILDRLANVAALIALLAIAAWPLAAQLAFSLGLHGLFIACSIAALGIGLATLAGWNRLHLASFNTLEPLHQLVRRPLRAVLVALLSFFSIGVAILAQWLVAQQLGINIGLADLAGVICVTTLIVLLPVSLNGVGLQEATFVVLLAQFGVPDHLGLAYALVVRGLILATSLLAGAVIVADRIASRYGHSATS